MIDLSHIDLLALAGTDSTLKRAAATNGGEWAGPCPACGGRDRFRLWPKPTQGNPRFWCRQCAARGDAIDYLRWLEPGLSFKAACERLGVGTSPKSPASPRRSRARPTPPKDPVPRPLTHSWAALTSEIWQARARIFVQECREALWEACGRGALDYLHKRGLSDTTIRAAGLGYNREALAEPRAAWGLLDEETGKQVWLPPGVVIPWEIGKLLWRVNVRRLDDKSKASKYLQPAGCAVGLYNADALRAGATVILVEGEFCALSLMQVAGDLATPAASGSVSGARQPRWLAKLALAERVLLAFDADEAGDRAAAWWLARLDGERARRLRPTRHDVNAMLLAGEDLRGWINSPRASGSRGDTVL